MVTFPICNKGNKRITDEEKYCQLHVQIFNIWVNTPASKFPKETERPNNTDFVTKKRQPFIIFTIQGTATNSFKKFW